MKKFLIIGNMNAITNKDMFPLIKNNKVWMGATYFNGGAAYFYGDASLYDESKVVDPKHYYVKDGFLFWRVNGVRWFTNLDHQKRHQEIDLYKHYNEEEYPKYDNYSAINVNKVSDIPIDYDGVMGVPLTFIEKYCPTQFEILGIACGNSWANYPDLLKSLGFNPAIKYGGGLGTGVINGKAVYTRILIKRVSK